MKFTLSRNSSRVLALFSILLSIYSGAIYSGQNTEVLPATQGVKLESDSSLYWLHFDKDADAVWSILKKFWEKEGIEIDKENMQLGYMQTKWVEDPSSDKFRSFLLSDKAPEYRERFRLRIERLQNNAGSRVYIYHSSYGILLDEEAVYTGYLPPSPELEIEMLTRLALFSGVSKTQLKQPVSTYIPVKLQAAAIENNQFEILMPGSLEFVSKKLNSALERLNLKFEEKSGGTLVVSNENYVDLTDKNIEQERKEWSIDDSSDLEEDGFDYDPEKDKPQKQVDQYAINLTQNKSAVTIRLHHFTKNDLSKSDYLELKKFSQAVARNLNR